MATLALALVGEAFNQSESQQKRYKTDMVIDLVYPLEIAKEDSLVKYIRERALSALSMRLSRSGHDCYHRIPKERMAKTMKKVLGEDKDWGQPAIKFIEHLEILAEGAPENSSANLREVIAKLNKGGFLDVLDTKCGPLPHGLDQCSSDDLRRIAYAFLPRPIPNIKHSEIGKGSKLITGVKAVEWLQDQNHFLTPKMVASQRFPLDHPLHLQVTDSLRKCLRNLARGNDWESIKIRGTNAYSAKNIFTAYWDPEISETGEKLFSDLAELYKRAGDGPNLPEEKLYLLFHQLNQGHFEIITSTNIDEQGGIEHALPSLTKVDLRTLLYWFGAVKESIIEEDQPFETKEVLEKAPKLFRKKRLAWIAVAFFVALAAFPFFGRTKHILRTQGLAAAYRHMLKAPYSDPYEYQWSGVLYMRRGEYQKAEKVAFDVLATASDNYSKSNMSWLLGMIHLRNGLFNGSVAFFENALTLAETEDARVQMRLNAALSYIYLDDMDKSWNHIQRAEEALSEKEEKRGLFYFVNGRWYMESGEYNKAWEWAEKRYSLHQKTKNIDALGESASELGFIHAMRGDLSLALDMTIEAEDIIQKTGDRRAFLMNQINYIAIARAKGHSSPKKLLDQIEDWIESKNDILMAHDLQLALNGRQSNH